MVTAGFDLEGAPDVHPRIAYVLVRSADHWRIDDVRYLDDGHTLRQLLRGGPAAATPAPPRASAPLPAPAPAEAGPKPLRLDTPARFAAYPAGPVYRGPAAPVILDTADKRAFRTRLRAMAADPVSFAGEYALSLWGCGGGCVQGAVVSKRTGAVTALPGSASGWDRVPASFRPFVYRADSNLLVVFGQVNEEGPVAATFYRFVGGTFIKFKVVPISSDMPGYEAYVARL
ncbi:hypothetical protein GCM10025880_29880 [Methylorubrum aminovorans]|uniref:hypothetical protein n=1 Tax=Methylorubrum aminovorans TaxID=269069 RepID=UPI0023E91906|nr:hypothetical protein [Methylorubrum aminovorans]GMA76571.1 hypothetical protein GCM10025880_29880 [Methylorubrum aminovorans]